MAPSAKRHLTVQRLVSADIERLRLFLEETAVACDLSTFGSVILPAVQKLVPSVLACFAQIDPVSAKLVAQEVYTKAPPPKDGGAFERHMFEHPVFEEWGKTGVFGASPFGSPQQNKLASAWPL
jgi:hypothetical protein